MGKKIQGLPAESLTLFVMPPIAQAATNNADAYREKCECVVFLGARQVGLGCGTRSA